MTIKQIYRKGIAKCVKELFDKQSQNDSEKERTPEEDTQILRNYFRNRTLTGFYNDGTQTTEHVAVFVPKEIGIIIKKYLDIPEDEREDVDFDFSFESVFETGGGVALLQMSYDSDDRLPKPCQLFGPTVVIQDDDKTASSRDVDECDIIEDYDADNTFQWRFHLA